MPQVYPISVVEIEISIWSYEEEVKKGAQTSTLILYVSSLMNVASRCDRSRAWRRRRRLLVSLRLQRTRSCPNVECSPLGHGFLTGQIQSIDDLSRQSIYTRPISPPLNSPLL